jgi:hypothetical protein
MPEYLELNFNTAKTSMINMLKASEVFNDYNYEGANITIITELLAYVIELSSYYLNKLAANTYMDTADVYENVHRIANMMGYYPTGHISSKSTITITITEAVTAGTYTVNVGDTITISAWKQLKSNVMVDDNEVYFATTTNTIATIDAFPYTISNIPVRQGIVRIFEFTGNDLIDNKLYLPFLNFSHDIDEENPCIEVKVNDKKWLRVEDFYDYLSGYYTEDNVYMFVYGKFKNYYVEFSDARNVPAENDIITVIVLESIGKSGNVRATTGTETWEAVDDIVYNNTTGYKINISNYNITHQSPSSAGDDPEDIETIKTNAKATLFAQYRNVTAIDYVTYLLNRSDIRAAKVWGEQDIAPYGSIEDYNRVYIAVIPETWGSSTIDYVEVEISGCNEKLKIPLNYADTWKQTLSLYLEKRKMLATYELFVVPELVYFRFNIGLGVKSTYSYNSVLNDVKNKLSYYFSSGQRKFGETLDFDHIEEYIKNPENTSPNNTFSQCKGIESFIIRNIDYYDIINKVWKNPYEYTSDLYPRYAVTILPSWEENNLRSIYLGPGQFPLVHIESCIILQRRYGTSVK